MTLKVIERPRLSSEPIRVPVAAEENGAVFVPTTMMVEMAFISLTANPPAEPSTWTAGVWDVDATTDTIIYRAQAKPPTLPAGEYTVWLRLTGTDQPVRKVGILRLV